MIRLMEQRALSVHEILILGWVLLREILMSMLF